MDTERGHYVRRYKHPERNEKFYTMAWTTFTSIPSAVTDEDEKSTHNVLAVAGEIGTIKLLDTKKNECYRLLFGHRRAILGMTFSKKQPNWLFSTVQSIFLSSVFHIHCFFHIAASADLTVRLWDIGTFDFHNDDSMYV